MKKIYHRHKFICSMINLNIFFQIFDKEFKENKEFPQQMLETPKNSSLERATAKSKNSLKIGKSNLTEGAAAKVSKDEEYIKNITEYSRELKEKEHNRHMEIMELQHNRQMRYMRLKHEMEKREHEIKMKVQAELLKHASLKTKLLEAESQNK
ncbi:DNA ligase 1-like [Diabrotica virgifera virgifera]|uniref:Uncharacterized protein n=1 Tax=Diabrotica virgifera virgifera TaxID=50390 RepID=A0ABM5K648_DIAVI|nr:DNA ligase 1-like [Diabrotica virgifera virgifera]